MKFVVIIPVRAIVTFEVEAADEEQAKYKAEQELSDNGEQDAMGVDITSGWDSELGDIEVHRG